MKAAFWKWLVVVQFVCIMGLIVGGVWWIREIRSQTRISTLRALYEYLKPAPLGDKVLVPVVVDVAMEHGEIRRYLNGNPMDPDELSDFAEQLVKASGDWDPIVVRPAVGIPIERTLEVMRLLMASGLKIFILPVLPDATLAITDRNITSKGELPALPPEFPEKAK